MGYHSDVQTVLAQKLEAEFGRDVPVLNGLATTEAQSNNYAKFILIVREDIDFDPHEPINPNPTSSQQPERWTWLIDVKGGGGAQRAAEAGAEVDLFLEIVRDTLGAEKLTTDCGPLHLESEIYVGNSGAGVVYRQTWWHERF